MINKRHCWRCCFTAPFLVLRNAVLVRSSITIPEIVHPTGALPPPPAADSVPGEPQYQYIQAGVYQAKVPWNLTAASPLRSSSSASMDSSCYCCCSIRHPFSFRLRGEVFFVIARVLSLCPLVND